MNHRVRHVLPALRYLLDEYHGNLTRALAAYNGGDTNVNRRVAPTHGRGTAFTVDDLPFPETSAYVQRVLTDERDYLNKYAAQLGYEQH